MRVISNFSENLRIYLFACQGNKKIPEVNACLLRRESHLCLFGKVCSVEMELFSLGVEPLLIEVSLRYSHVQMVHQSLKYTVGVYCVSRDGILGHQFNQKSRVFCPMLFTVPSTGGFKENHTLLWFLNPYKKSTKQVYS